MKKNTLLLAVLLFLQGHLCGQNPNTAAFPTTVATDTNLAVAKRLSQSTLSASATSGATTISVSDGTQFLAGEIIRIDSEELQITGISSNTLTVTRAFNGTTAASHTSGATVQGIITSWHHNQMSAEMQAVEARLRETTSGCQDAGSTDSYACNLSPAIASYTTGSVYRFKAATANTGAASINFNSLGAKTIKKHSSGGLADLSDNDISAGDWVYVVYDGTYMQMVGGVGSGGGTWGSITGTLSSQSDLQSALDAKAGLSANNTMTGDNNFTGKIRLPATTVSSLPTASSNSGRIFVVTDSLGGSCTSGSGTAIVLCRSDGSAWVRMDILYSNGFGLKNSCSGQACSLGVDFDDFGYNLNCTASTSSGTVYACSLPNSVLTTYNSGLIVAFGIGTTACTGSTATTVSVGGIGAKRLYRYDGSSDPLSSECVAGSRLLLLYDSTLNSAAGGWRIVGGTSPGGSGVSRFGDLSDCKVIVASAVATITAPCRMRSGTQVVTLSSDATATLSGTPASGAVYFYWVPGASLPTASESTSATLTCNAGCTTDTAGAFATGSVPIASAAFTSNVFGTVTEYRAALGRDIVESGDPAVTISENGSTGVRSISLDTTSVLAKLPTVQSGSPLRCNSTTGSMTYTCAMSPTLTGYTTGMVVEFGCATTALTGAATLNIDGLGAKSIKKSDGTSNPASGDCAAGQQVPLRYDGTVFRLPSGGASSPLIAKGDIWTFGSADTRLAVGSVDGQVLGVDSAQTTGLKYSYLKVRDNIPPCGQFNATGYPASGWGWVGTTGGSTDGCQPLGGTGTLAPKTAGVSFAGSTSQYVTYLWKSPIDWVPANGVTFRLSAITTATSGNYKLAVRALCIAAGSSQFPLTPSWGTEVTATTAAGVNSEELLYSITLTAGQMGTCTAGRSIWFLIGTPDTTNSSYLYLHGATLEYDRKAF